MLRLESARCDWDGYLNAVSRFCSDDNIFARSSGRSLRALATAASWIRHVDSAHM